MTCGPFQMDGVDPREIPCSAADMARVAKRQPAAKEEPQPQPDLMPQDVRVVCEQIHDLARAKGWDLKKLAKHAGRPFQSFLNWKKGHTLPNVEYLQDFARAVGVNVRVAINDAQQSTGAPPMTQDTKRLLGIYRRLTEKDQRALLDSALDLLSGDENFDEPDGE